jgi:hypothetical protein
MNKTIKISNEFSETPGARHRSDGDFSGQEFFEEILEPAYLSLKENEKIIIDLDGTDGYATSFLDEAFGGLARKYGKQNVLNKIEFISEEEPFLIDEIKTYMNGSKN